MKLTGDHIAYIIKDLNYRGIVAEQIQDELVDHVCTAVEREMATGKKFIDAYQTVLCSFGNTSGLRDTQRQTLTVESPKTITMFKNYLTIAWRNLHKQSFYSLINVAGLAVGIAACLVIVLFIVDEISYDRFNTHADRIYRVEAEVKFGGNQFRMAYRPAPEAAALAQDYPEVESVVRLCSGGTYLVKTTDQAVNLKARNVIWADSTFFSIFSVNVIEGNGAKALTAPASVAISRRMAEKYYPGTSALGKPVILDNNYHMTVTAVYDNLPSTSHFHFDIIVSMHGDFPIARSAQSTSFMSENFSEYVLLRKGADAAAFEKKLPAFIDKYMGPEVVKALGPDFSLEKFKAQGNLYNLSLRPLTDIHLQGDVRGELEPNGNVIYIILLAVVAGFILVIACINFMNLSTARSANRAKEVGVRKVMGSLRTHLVRQFLMESTLVTLFSFVLALLLAYLLIPVFNSLSQKQLQLPFAEPAFYLILLGACLVIGLMAGLYPSFFLSAFKPVNVLKGNVSAGMKSGFIRSGLVVFQFVISIFLIIGAISINRQLAFIQTKRLGFEKDQVVIIHDGYALRPNNVTPFKNEALKLSSIETGTISGFLPVENEGAWRSNSSFWKYGSPATVDNMVGTELWAVDYDYIKTFRMKIKNGRGFSPEFQADSTGLVINETAAKRLGIMDDPIGQRINTFEGPPDPANIRTWTVVGVIEDFHFTTMKQNISALGLVLGNSDGSVSFRFDPTRTSEVIQSLEKIWKRLAPGQPFQYSFLDQDFAKMYEAEQRLGEIFSLFAGLAIIIACLGLFALTAYTAEQRTKEIGVRKVLGASVQSIVLLLSREFGKLVVIAFLLASPVAWYAITWWLNGYSYRVEIGWVVYALSGVLALAIAFVTMSFQSVKAALANPIHSLRNE